MRSRIRDIAAAVAFVTVAVMAWPSWSSADTPDTPARSDVSPMDALALVQRVERGPSVDFVFTSLTGLTVEETWEQLAQTEGTLRATLLQQRVDDRHLAGAQAAVDELRLEANQIAEATVTGAISNYRNNDLEQDPLTTDDLNAVLRANALGDAALVADSATFDRYSQTTKDLMIAEYHLTAWEVESAQTQAEVEALRAQLEAEQAWLADLEERDLHRRTHDEWTTESIWSQQLGTKQGFYLRTCPVRGDHHFIDSWGFPRSGGRRHKGVDLMARIGVPIVAPVDGVVSFRSNSVGGRSFHLTDEFGNYYYGTHLSAYGDVEGEVRAGQVIGYVGDDGNAAGIPHLHFEIHPGGRGNPINPFTDSAAVCDGVLY